MTAVDPALALARLPATRWREVGAALRRAGLTERAVLACFGVRAVAHVPRAIGAGRRFDAAPPPAAVLPWLLVGGGTVARAGAARGLGDALDALEAAGLVVAAPAAGADDDDDDADAGAPRVRATVAILPAGADALAVCDRADGDDAGAVMFPDDSSHHLIGALPRRRVERWLDVATGAALAPLSAAGRAREVVAVDLSPRAIAMARLGAALSGVPLALAVADLADGVDGGFDLVTANLPIPGERAGAGPRHRVSPPGADLIARFWRAAAARLAPGGEALLHAALDDDPLAALRALPGEVVVARYTPPGLAAFGVTAWRPDRPAARRVRDLALTRDAPHVDRAAVE